MRILFKIRKVKQMKKIVTVLAYITIVALVMFSSVAVAAESTPTKF